MNVSGKVKLTGAAVRKAHSEGDHAKNSKPEEGAGDQRSDNPCQEAEAAKADHRSIFSIHIEETS